MAVQSRAKQPTLSWRTPVTTAVPGEIRAKIQDCRVFLERLEAEREELEGILESFVFPVIGIPIEIITLIFRPSLPAHGRVKPSKHAAPLLLAHICRHWREIALSIPQLWSSRFDLPCNAIPPTILPTIAEVSQQWGRLEIKLPVSDVPTPDAISGPFPALHTLAISPSGRMPGRVLTAYEDAPQLREHLVLTISNKSIDNMLLLKCLRAVPSLEKLDISRPEMVSTLYEALQSPSLLPRLRELSVLEDGSHYSFEHVIGMLRARRDSHPTRVQLCSFDLVLDVRDNDPDQITSTPTSAAALKLDRLVAAGLRFRVHSDPIKWPAGFCGKLFHPHFLPDVLANDPTDDERRRLRGADESFRGGNKSSRIGIIPEVYKRKDSNILGHYTVPIPHSTYLYKESPIAFVHVFGQNLQLKCQNKPSCLSKIVCLPLEWKTAPTCNEGSWPDQEDQSAWMRR
ncbi:hypothetical protein FB451DRAFT_1184351 [Mycena latifolia]|nr:hypothetical protein FB451DRAFT_1184351 [Mycena latifolia]